MPERDIESLGVMGWGLEAARKFYHRRRILLLQVGRLLLEVGMLLLKLGMLLLTLDVILFEVGILLFK